MMCSFESHLVCRFEKSRESEHASVKKNLNESTVCWFKLCMYVCAHWWGMF